MQEFIVLGCMAIIITGLVVLYFGTGKTQLEETMEFFDRRLIDYQKQTTDTHIFLIVHTGTGNVLGVNSNEIRWKFNKKGALCTVDVI